jgi:endo-1,4-beta-xylanase
MTPENSLKPQFVHPQKDLYLFQDSDTLVEAAQNNKMTVHGHALVMGKANPEWMQKAPNIERKQVMTDHIAAVVGHYKGKIAEWDVVNEPLSEDDIDYSPEQMGMRKQMWFDAMGEEYIDTAFRAARSADPGAKLYLNDFGIEKDGKRWDALLALILRLQSRGVPINGVGFESHVYHAPADTIDPTVLRQHIQSLAALGIVSRISEIDVLGDDPAYQATQYADVLRVCIAEPTCTSYGVWGITDLYGSTTLADRYPIRYGDSLLWDTEYTPKPVLQSLQRVLSQP